MLFYASFLTLIAAGIGFSVRGAVLSDWGKQYRSFTPVRARNDHGRRPGPGFGVTIILLSFVADAIGYGRLMAPGVLAAHVFGHRHVRGNAGVCELRQGRGVLVP